MAKSEKVYYSIGQVASMYDVNTSLVRFWEKEFDVLKPHKSKKGTRYFTQQDMRYFHMIYHLVKEKGYTLQGAKEELKADFDRLEAKVLALQTLQKTKDFLLQLDEGLADKLKYSQK